METGGSSNIRRNYAIRAPNSGIVIREPNGDANNPTDHNDFDAQQAFKREPDQYVPIANVTRIMRRALPAHAKIADDAKEIIQECVSEFISFITGEANERCHTEYRKTITSEDIISAMASMGFENYIQPLRIYLNKIRAQDREQNAMHFMPSTKRNSSSFVQIQPRTTRPPPLVQMQPPLMDYAPPTSTYAIDSNNYVHLSQLGSNFFMHNLTGHGESPSNNLEKFDPFEQLK